jgi:hypothetical protein
MTKPTTEEWERLAKLNQHNAQMVADMKATHQAGGKVKRGHALRVQRSLVEAVRLEKNLKKRDGQT